jgi:hypothetical protein
LAGRRLRCLRLLTAPRPRFPAFPLSSVAAYFLPRLADDGNQVGHRHRRAGFHHVLEQRPGRPSHELHDRLVGLHLGKHVSNGNGLAFLLLPLHQAAFLHRGGKGLHYYFRRHERFRLRVVSLQSPVLATWKSGDWRLVTYSRYKT